MFDLSPESEPEEPPLPRIKMGRRVAAGSWGIATRDRMRQTFRNRFAFSNLPEQHPMTRFAPCVAGPSVREVSRSLVGGFAQRLPATRTHRHHRLLGV